MFAALGMFTYHALTTKGSLGTPAASLLYKLVQLVCRSGFTSCFIAQLCLSAQSMFGRDLVEQVNADAKGSDRFIPVIVEKCIEAVETLGMDYEGIYRKSGGSGQSKAITQLFERGNYENFDLTDTDAFNDISSVTSVLKNYFRVLPNPLLTFALHDSLVQAAGMNHF